MRLSILAACILAPLPALADGALVGSCVDSDARPYAVCPVNLTAGADYDFHAVEADGVTTLRLLEPSGREALSVTAPSNGNRSVEVRARVTGAYRLEVRSDPARPAGGAGVELYTDCRAGAGTRCRLAGTVRGATTGTADVDTYRARVAAGRRYAYTFDRGYGSVACGGRRWANHKGVIDFRAPATGTCLLSVARAGGPYTLAVGR